MKRNNRGTILACTIMRWNVGLVVGALLLAGCASYQQNSSKASKGETTASTPGNDKSFWSQSGKEQPKPLMKPLILRSESVAELVPEGGSTKLSVSVEGKEKYFYQWYLQGEKIFGATSSSLTITNVNTNNIGYYTCYATDGVRLGLSEPIQVLSLTTNLTFTYISARPAPVNGGLLGSCPGPYSGYVTFAWVKAIGGSATATATWAACSAIRWDSLYGNGCCLGSSCSLAAAANRWYGFTAYFPPGSPPSGTAIYTLQLSGFYP